VKTLDRFESYQVFVSAINRWCFHDRRWRHVGEISRRQLRTSTTTASGA